MGWAVEVGVAGGVGPRTIVAAALLRDGTAVVLDRRAVAVHEEPMAWPAHLRGAIESPRDGAVLGPFGATLRGWLPPDPTLVRIEVVIDGAVAMLARPLHPRPDLAAYSTDPLAVLGGFEAFLEPELVERGDVHLSVRAIDGAGHAHEVGPLLVRRGAVGASGSKPVMQITRRSGAAPGRRSRVVVHAHNLALGGAQVFVGMLAGQLHHRKVAEVAVVAPAGGMWRSALEGAGIPVRIVSPIPLHDAEAYEDRVAELAASYDHLGADVVVVNSRESFPAVDAALRLGVPVAWCVHEGTSLAHYWSAWPTEPDVHVAGRLEAALLGAHAVVFATDRTREVYDRWLGEGSADRGVTIPYGLDLDAMDRAATPAARTRLRDGLGLSPDGTLALWAARCSPIKAQLSLAEAARRLRPSHPSLVTALLGTPIAGSELYCDALERYVADAGLVDVVRCLPATTQPWPWHAAADLFVCPSDAESLPFAILEAMALGVPVVATDVAGIPDVVRPGATGWLVAPRDLASLTAGIAEALSDPGELARRAAAGRDLVRDRHSLEPWITAFAGLIDRLAS